MPQSSTTPVKRKESRVRIRVTGNASLAAWFVMGSEDPAVGSPLNNHPGPLPESLMPVNQAATQIICRQGDTSSPIFTSAQCGCRSLAEALERLSVTSITDDVGSGADSQSHPPRFAAGCSPWKRAAAPCGPLRLHRDNRPAKRSRRPTLNLDCRAAAAIVRVVCPGPPRFVTSLRGPSSWRMGA